MKTKVIVFLLLLLMFINCAPPKFYKETRSVFPKNGLEQKLNNRRVFIELEKYLKTSTHIIYHFVPDASFESKAFSGLIYDIDANKYFYIKKNANKEVTVDTVAEFPNDDYCKFVISNYEKGNFDYLKKLGEASNHSGIQTTEAIYDINLKSKEAKRFVFKSFLFMNGKPTKDVE